MGYGNTYDELLEIVIKKKNLKEKGDTYYSFNGLTKDQILKLANLVGYYEEDSDWKHTTQNDSPSIEEFLDLADEFGDDRILYTGYIILPPRTDFRVSIEGFDAVDLTSEEAIELMYRYGEADEKSYNQGYEVHFWWD